MKRPVSPPGKLDTLKQWWRRVTCPTEFLCDNCKNDHPSVCYRPQRPNAIKCPDYEPKS